MSRHCLSGNGASKAVYTIAERMLDECKRRFGRRSHPIQPTCSAVRFTSPATDWPQVFRSLAPSVQNEAKISIVTPLWNTNPTWLAEAAVSVFEQTCTAWEWCLVDDGSTNFQFEPILRALLQASPRIKFKRIEHGGISAATNAGLRLARAPYVCFLDHDDLLVSDAIELSLARVLDADAVYTDSDKATGEGARGEPFRKPDWSPELFRGAMYVGHLLCVRREEALALGGFDSHFDGVQDFEFFLRYSERHPRVAHIARVLYHWRTVPGSIAAALDAKDNITPLQREAVASQLARLGLNSTAVAGPRAHRVTIVPNARVVWPRVSIITAVEAPSSYPNLEVIQLPCTVGTRNRPWPLWGKLQLARSFSSAVPLSDSSPTEVPRKPKLAPQTRISQLLNHAAATATGDFLLFTQSPIEPAWLEQLLYYAGQPDTGAVGFAHGPPDPIFDGLPRECSAVSAACLLIRRDLFLQLGGFNQHYFHSYFDVDLCLRLRALGKRNIGTPIPIQVTHQPDPIDRALLNDTWQDLASDPFHRSVTQPQV